MIVKTNVKLNLGLSVLRKRPDGFHDIETLFVPCFDFGDTLEIITGDDYSRTSAALFAKYGAAEYPLNDDCDAAEPHKAANTEGFPNQSETSTRVVGKHYPGDVIVGEGSPNPNETSAREERSASGQVTTASPNEKAKTVYSGQITLSEDGRLVQGISEDGKLMITIARGKGVDWNPLKDLCAKAYNILAQDFDLPPVKIFLEKTAPVGAGLGGGSADAAFTLKALNELCGLNLSDQRLSEYAARLGSDCSFFIFNRPMIGSGRGEILEPYDIDLSEYETKVLVPEGIAVSTAEAYKGIVPREKAELFHSSPSSSESTSPSCSPSSQTSHRALCPDATTTRLQETTQLETIKSKETASVRDSQVATASSPDVATVQPPEAVTANSPDVAMVSPLELREALALPVTEWKDNLVNDFEATVFKAYPELAAIKRSLYDSGAVYASMSGSGSALFALYRK